jgi:hypothetical protein
MGIDMHQGRQKILGMFVESTSNHLTKRAGKAA